MKGMKIKHKRRPFPSKEDMVYMIKNHPVFSTYGSKKVKILEVLLTGTAYLLHR
jgi:hypothetical protein